MTQEQHLEREEFCYAGKLFCTKCNEQLKLRSIEDTRFKLAVDHNNVVHPRQPRQDDRTHYELRY